MASSTLARAVFDPEEIQVLALALKVGLLVVLVSLIPGVAMAYLIARWRSPWRRVVQALVLLPLVLPPVVTGYVLLQFLGRSSLLGKAWHGLTGMHLSYSTTASVIAAAVVGFPLLVESIRLSMVGIDPRLEKISRSQGFGPWQTFRRVTLPLCLPGIFAGVTLCFARALGEFGATIILAGNIPGETRQIPLAVYTLLNQAGKEGAVLRLCLVSIALAPFVFGRQPLDAQQEREGGG